MSRYSLSWDWDFGRRPWALVYISMQCRSESRGDDADFKALSTSPVRMTPSFSSSKFSTSKRWKSAQASLISSSCSAEMSFSLASFERRAVGFA